MQILNYILHAKESEDQEPQFMDLMERIPFMEAEMRDGTVGADKLAKLTSPRFMKTHIPYQIWQKQLEKHPNLKVIQVIRNPKDTLVSYYHHMQNDHSLGDFKGTWNQFFKVFKEEKLPSGDFFQVTYDWYRFSKDRENSLVLVNEEMKKDPKAHIITIANFINQPISDKVADVITEKTSVKQMSAVVHDTMKQLTAWNPEKKFVRKGIVGDWMNYFSEEQSQYVDEKCQKYLEPLGLKFEYTI